ncbi:DNA excision repair protein ERCC-2 [Silvimonas terrae]|uniref:DNA excision repair protein ERCC-2 n=1 Tax=Silvimonas terrae TaxID=300266 RepID=A0A840REE0_9NEIS|nr:ATP-dependent DNA helicase [Silvimonas terrae]MBB5190621.1 DNA excision repair protein ERCC-2 [Silvimonas terrae]
MKYNVAVRELCEFVAKRGDLDLRFTPAPSAQEGMAGHQTVTLRRGARYLTEITLAGEFGPLQVRGRADGYDPGQNQIDEIKTYRGRLERMPENHRHLHWAQARIYGWLLCKTMELTSLTVALVYYHVTTGRETILREEHTATSLKAFFDECCGTFLAWAEQEIAHQTTRKAALTTLAFPHADFRPGQRDLAETVYKAAHTGRALLAQAPTGIGKTMGTLFPLLKAVATDKLDRVFCLAAKTSGRALIQESLTKLRRSAPDLPLRSLEMVARDKTCEHPDKSCHGESCPLAKGFYDRLPAARAAALTRLHMDQATIRHVALDHQICPYYLSQEMARWADVVSGDYNYYFDSNALLFSLTQMRDWRVGVLTDEAHNLIERARAMYTGEMAQSTLKALGKNPPAPLKKSLKKLAHAWTDIVATQTVPYLVYTRLPDRLVMALMSVVADFSEVLAEEPDSLSPDLLNFYFDAVHLTRLAETFGPHSWFEVTLSGEGRYADSVLRIRNIVPAPHLQPRFETAQTAVLFSATLNPFGFYIDTLGMPATTAQSDISSPFHPDQLNVQVVTDVSTRFNDRGASIAPIADLIARQFADAPGNYLAFFSSFDYLQQVEQALRQRHPHLTLWPQQRQMSEPARNEFLARFTESSAGVGLAVLGGAFAEGIDLPGSRLIGAFVATLGLPQVNPVNEEMRQRMDDIFGTGYDYTYLYPGLQKVVQAAGRVIRTLEDRGTLYLIDDRFAQPRVRQLLPDWWQLQYMACRTSRPIIPDQASPPTSR